MKQATPSSKLEQILRQSAEDNRLSGPERDEILVEVEILKPDLEQLTKAALEVDGYYSEQGYRRNWLKQFVAFISRLHVGNRRHNAWFSPGGEIKSVLIHALEGAKERLWLSIFNLTDRDLAKRLLQASGSGVDIKIIADESAASQTNSQVRKLLKASLPVKLLRIPNGLMHNKYLISDQLVFTGSYNWTRQAIRNHENLVRITEARVVEKFVQDFKRLFARD